MRRAVVTAVGAGVSFASAAVAGVVGNQLRPGAWWVWGVFVAVLVLGASVTAVVTYRTATPARAAPPVDGGSTVEPATARPASPAGGGATVGPVTAHGGPAVGVNEGVVNYHQAPPERRP